MKKIVVSIFSFFAIGASLIAQDRVFTQFYASPLTLNPALTGAFEGRYRVGGIYRNQWSGILQQPYNTFSFGADLRFDPFRSKVAKDKVGVGLLFFRDKVNALDFSTTQIAVSGAYHKSLDPSTGQYLSGGLQIGLTQRNVNYETLTFLDQWDGIAGFTGRTNEPLPANNFGFNDISLGVNYAINPSPKSAFFAGIALHHVNSPNVAFFRGEDIPESRLATRYSLQLSGQFPINKSHTVLMSPRLLVAAQGPHLTGNVGTNFRILVDKTYGSSLHIGSWVRPVRYDNGFNLDAVVLLAGFEYNGILLGFSYDLNLPTLQKFKRQQNVFEISLVYLGEYDDDTLLCPSF